MSCRIQAVFGWTRAIAHLVVMLVMTTAHAEPATPAVKVVEMRAQPIAYRTVKAAPSELEAKLREAFLALVGAATIHNLEIAGPPLARYLSRGSKDDPTFIVEAALPLRKRPSKALGQAAMLGTLSAGSAATLVHRGRLDQIPQAHAALDAWLSANKRTVAGARWEVYVTNPITHPDPEKQEVTVVVPLAR